MPTLHKQKGECLQHFTTQRVKMFANTTQTTKNMLIISHNTKKKYICQHNRNKNKNTHNTLQQKNKDKIVYIRYKT